MNNVLSNSEAEKLAVLQECEDFGQREGSGAAARANFYVRLTELSKGKGIDVSNAEECWDRFDKGASRGASIIGGIKAAGTTSDPNDTRKVRVSECRQFLKLGGQIYVDGVEVLDRAVAIIKKARLEGRLKAKATDAMIAVARAQNNDEQNPLDDQTIEIVIQPKEGAEKVEADALEAVRVTLEKISKKFEESDEVNDAIGYVQKRIDALGGTSKQQKARASAAALKAAAGAGKPKGKKKK